MRIAAIIGLVMLAAIVAAVAWRWHQRRMDAIREQHEAEAIKTAEDLARFMDM